MAGGEGVTSCNGTTEGWSVEGRSVFLRAEEINGQLFDERWQRVQFIKGPIGVPNNSWDEPWLSRMGLHSYAAAQALRWWFHANADLSACLETRLVRHRVKYSVASERVDEHCLIGGEDRSSIMPDWPRPVSAQ